MLFAEREHHALALASSAPWLARSVGFVGVSDGWQELHAHKRLDHTYTRAENGNVARHRRNRSGVVRRNVRDGARIRADRDGGRSARAHQRCSKTSTRHTPSTSAQWQAWHATTRQTASRRSSERRSIRSAPRCCGHTNRNAWKAGSSPACRFRGDSRSPTTTSAAITWCGRGISWRSPAGSSPSARTSTSGACCATCR